METNCFICNVLFKPHRKEQKCCSYSCGILKRYPTKKRICAHCKIEFIVTADKKENLYCSKECFEKFRSKRIDIVCKQCKNITKKIPSLKGISSYCNRICKYKHLSEIRSKQIGEKNSNFKHGLSGKAIRIYRNIAMENFPHECAICKRNNIRLEVHHKDHNRQNPSIDNLMILCSRCHIKHHRGSLIIQ